MRSGSIWIAVLCSMCLIPVWLVCVCLKLLGGHLLSGSLLQYGRATKSSCGVTLFWFRQLFGGIKLFYDFFHVTKKKPACWSSWSVLWGELWLQLLAFFCATVKIWLGMHSNEFFRAKHNALEEPWVSFVLFFYCSRKLLSNVSLQTEQHGVGIQFCLFTQTFPYLLAQEAKPAGSFLDLSIKSV